MFESCLARLGQALASNGLEVAREWALALGTLILAVFTFLLWRSTQRMADKTADAAREAASAALAARESTEVARQGLALETERWQTERLDRIAAHARMVEVHLTHLADAGAGVIECRNRGSHSISKVVLHIKVADDEWVTWNEVFIDSGHSYKWRDFSLDRVNFPDLKAVEAAVRACVTFKDADGRSWLRWVDNERLEEYAGNIVQIVGHWHSPT